MSTVVKRLEEAHIHLLNLYTSIPALTPCLEKIKINQAEFVTLNNRLRHLPEDIATGQHKADKVRRQLDSVFTINKAECEKTYRQEINELKAFEDEHRACLRQRDNVVTERLQLHKERATLLEETRKLKKLNESVFDRSKDEIANADFPEELHWQLELKEYDFKISEVKRQVSKYNTALSNLARGANLSEAALMAFLGYPDAAYKVWRVEYALQASRKMRLYLRVELSLSNAYTNENVAREACPNILPPFATPIKPSTVQGYFESTSKKSIIRFDAESQLRAYIAHLRSAQKTAEMLLAQETERLGAMQAYREAIVPLLAKIRRHVFQNSCIGGYRIEGWENEQGQSLLGTEADILVRGCIHGIGTPTLNRPSSSSSSSQAVPAGQRTSVEMTNGDEEAMNTRSRDWRGNTLSVQVGDDQEISTDPTRPVVIDHGRMVMSAGKVPLSTLAPSNVLGSEILMRVDRVRQEKLAKAERKSKGKHKSRSRSRSGQDIDSGAGPASDNQQLQGSNEFSAPGSPNVSGGSSSSNNIQGEREGRRKTTRRLFGFARSRREGSSGSEDAVVPTTPSPRSPVFSMTGNNNRSSVDILNSSSHGDASSNSNDDDIQQSHRRNVPSISVSNHDTMVTGIGATPFTSSMVPTLPRIISMVPSYEEHQQHKAVDPESLHMVTSSASYEELSPLEEYSTMQSVMQPEQEHPYIQSTARPRSRSTSSHPHSMNLSAILDSSISGASSSTTRSQYHYHHHSFSDQTPDASSWGQNIPPPDYVTRPPEYTA